MSYRSPPASSRMNRVLARESPHQTRNMFATIAEAEEYGKSCLACHPCTLHVIIGASHI
jgi:hypothetical protein